MTAPNVSTTRLLHVSLFLFLAGLVVFLLPLNPAIAYVVSGIAGFLCVIYTTAIILPVFFIQCPYRTQLSETLYRLYGSTRSLLSKILKRLHANPTWPKWLSTLKDAERRLANDEDSRKNNALLWLARITSDPSAKAIVAEAVGSAHPWSFNVRR